MTAANKEEDNESLSQKNPDKPIPGDEQDESSSGVDLDEPLSQEDLDKLISGDEQDESSSGADLDDLLSQEDLDKLISGDELDESGSGNDLDEPLSQEDLDKLISGDEQDESNSEGELDETISQGELDKLISGEEQVELNPGDELDEPISRDELDEQTSADELDELDEPISADELNEPDLGDELDEPVSAGELDEPDLGDELDEPISADESGEPIAKKELESEIDSEEISKKKDAEDPEKKHKGKNKLVGFVAKKYKHKRKFLIAATVVLCLLTGAGYLSMQNKKERVPEAIKLPVMAGRSLVFDSFVIPFREHNKFAYLSLDISFRLMDSELEEEMTAKRDLLRGIIYDLLRETVNKTGKLPPLDKLKEYIVEGVNNALSTGKVKEAYVIDFLAV